MSKAATTSKAYRLREKLKNRKKLSDAEAKWLKEYQRTHRPRKQRKAFAQAMLVEEPPTPTPVVESAPESTDATESPAVVAGGDAVPVAEPVAAGDEYAHLPPVALPPPTPEQREAMEAAGVAPAAAAGGPPASPMEPQGAEALAEQLCEFVEGINEDTKARGGRFVLKSSVVQGFVRPAAVRMARRLDLEQKLSSEKADAAVVAGAVGFSVLQNMRARKNEKKQEAARVPPPPPAALEPTTPVAAPLPSSSPAAAIAPKPEFPPAPAKELCIA